MLVHCERCGYEGKTKKKGNWAVAILLIFCFFVPGIIYLFWMFSGARLSCPACFQPYPMPLAVFRRFCPTCGRACVQGRCPSCAAAAANAAKG